MKTLITIVQVTLCSFVVAQTWNQNLNSVANPTAGIGTSNSQSLRFYTNGQQRLEITENGVLRMSDTTAKFGIGVSNPTVNLDVRGNSKVSKNLDVHQDIYVGGNDNNYGLIRYTPGTNGNPNIFSIISAGSVGGVGGVGHKFEETGHSEDPGGGWCWGGGYYPVTAMGFPEMISLVKRDVNNVYVGNLALGHKGTNAFIESQAAQTGTLDNTGDLVINERCGRNVYIFGQMGFEVNSGGIAHVNGKFSVNRNMQIGFINDLAFLDNSVKLYINGNSSGGGIKLRQTNLTGQYGFKIVEQNATDEALSVYLSGNTSSDGTVQFKVQADGKTCVGSGVNQLTSSRLTVADTYTSKAFAVYDNNVNGPTEVMSIDGSGYTEIKVRSPLLMPKPYGSSNQRVFTIRDMANQKDLFVVRHDGKIYAREVEISLTASFPDYVFSPSYRLMPIVQVRTFIDQNGRLPGFEPADYYKEHGLQVCEIILHQQEQLERQMLYILELEDRIASIEKQKR